MTIYDYWLNPLVPTPIQVIGYHGSVEDFPYDLYSFLLSTIRDQDQNDVALIWRWIQPMQQFWETIYGQITALIYVKSPEDCPIEFLDYLRKDIGICDDISYLWGSLVESDKRKLIKFFIRYLKYRNTLFGINESLENILGIPIEIKNYFYFRWVVSGDLTSETEVAIGREDDGYDTWVLSEPNMNSGAIPDLVTVTTVSDIKFYNFQLNRFINEVEERPLPNYVYIKSIGSNSGEFALLYYDGINWMATMSPDFVFLQLSSSLSTEPSNFRVSFESDEFVSDIMIEDNGTVNRDIVYGLVRFNRPLSERIYIRYYNLIDNFVNFNKWDEIEGTATYSEDNENVVLSDVSLITTIQCNLDGSEDWNSYCVHVKMNHNVNEKYIHIRFMVQDLDDYYYIVLIPSNPPDIPAGTWQIRRIVSSVDSLLDSGNLDWFDINVDYIWRIESLLSSRPGGQVQIIRLYQDENLLTTYVDTPAPWSGSAKGTVEISVEDGGSCTVSRVLVHPLPMESVYVGP